ncbi:MAG: RnfH family protein, partial [Ottowia sp.]
GVAVAPSTPLREGDRVELLRPLQLDPKEARRRRAQRQRGG